MLASFFSRNQTGGNSTIWELPSCTPCLLEEKGEAGGFIVLLKKETHTPHLCFIVRTNHVRINIIINIALFHSTLAGAPSMNGGQSPKVSILGERARQRDTERKRDRERKGERDECPLGAAVRNHSVPSLPHPFHPKPRSYSRKRESDPNS